MNIREHIEAGHYPKDEKGRALVPMCNHGVATIYATDHTDGGMVIVGRVSVAGQDHLQHWRADGVQERAAKLGLLPPPPRKVKMVRWHAIDKQQNTLGWWGDEPAKCDIPADCRLVRFTGEYEEPWS